LLRSWGGDVAAAARNHFEGADRGRGPGGPGGGQGAPEPRTSKWEVRTLEGAWVGFGMDDSGRLERRREEGGGGGRVSVTTLSGVEYLVDLDPDAGSYMSAIAAAGGRRPQQIRRTEVALAASTEVETLGPPQRCGYTRAHFHDAVYICCTYRDSRCKRECGGMMTKCPRLSRPAAQAGGAPE
jgi:hypothetical protein